MFSSLLIVLFTAKAFGGELGNVVRTFPKNEKELKYLNSLADNNDIELDFWTHPSHVGHPVDIRVTNEKYDTLTLLLKAQDLLFKDQISDVDEAVAMQTPAGEARSFDYNNYNRLPQIEQEIKRLVGVGSRIATLIDVGGSYERRRIYAVKLSSGSGKKTLFMNCGIHAREWITPATCMYMLREIITKHGSDSSISAILNKLDVIIMPVLNVDGYTYTWNGGRARMWRKTRSPQSGGCVGADPNRNYNAKWGGAGTSSNPCSDTYPGTRPFSEIETRNVAHFLYNIRSSLVGYLDIHAYSQFWMTPYGHAKGAYPPTYNEMMRVASIATNALKRFYGTSYRHGSVADIIYSATGGTIDWAAATLGVKYSYGLELRDRGRYGFLLPANQIKPTGEETFGAIKAMIREMRI